MNVLIAGNDVAYDGIELVVYTLLSTNKDVNIYIFTMDADIYNPETGCGTMYKSIQPYQKEKLKKIVRYLDCKSNICFKDVHDLYMEHLDKSVNRHTSFTPYTALRLLADLALPYIKDLLYLDCDVAITGDIRPIYNDFVHRGCNYGAYVTPDACGGKGEMVAGVMFMNLELMRANGFLATARRNYNTNLYNFPDQCAIRDSGDPVHFPPTMGYCDNLDDFDGLPLIIHFTNRISPKIYCAKNREFFFKKFPFLNYAKEGIALLDTIH